MADEEVKEEQQPAESAGEKSPIVKILLVVIIAVILIGLTAIVAYFVGMKVKEPPLDASGERQEVRKIEPHVTYSIGEIRSVLPGNHNFKAIVVLAYEKKYDNAAFRNEISSRRTQIINLILRILMRKSKEDLAGPNIDKFAEELRININNILMNGQIVDVYFEEWVVQ